MSNLKYMRARENTSQHTYLFYNVDVSISIDKNKNENKTKIFTQKNWNFVKFAQNYNPCTEQYLLANYLVKNGLTINKNLGVEFILYLWYNKQTNFIFKQKNP